MRVNMRREHRNVSRKTYALTWQDDSGMTRSGKGIGVDASRSGIGLRCSAEVTPGRTVYIQAQDGHPTGYSVVRHCTKGPAGYLLGLELDEAARGTVPTPRDGATDYYEFLQISPKAEAETIHRIYRYLAARFHPDNPQTGDPEKFLILNQAFEVLSDVDRRAEYDASRDREAGPSPEFAAVDFMDGMDGEVNRRLAVLSVLYRRCRANVDGPKVSLAELEMQMGFPREYLDFTTWYLRSKKYITREDNSDFALTADGVDFVEANYAKLPVLRRLLNAGSKPPEGRAEQASEGSQDREGMFILGPGGATDKDPFQD